MKNLLRRILSIQFGPITFPLFLLALCLAAYTPFITRVGFYWDDFPMNWIASTMGGEGLARYFATNRPVWGLVYRVTTALLGSRPVTWQIFAILMRWVTGLALWALLRLVWRNPQSMQNSTGRQSQARDAFAAWAAALFVIYPGFSQQFIAFLYSHFFIILSVFLLSLTCMALSLRIRDRRWFWPLTLLALLLSLQNMLSMEYFFLLDLLRPLLIWIILSSSVPEHGKRLRQTLLLWLPYLALFAGAMYWRSVLFGFHTYQPALMSRIKAQPVQAILGLIPIVFGDVYRASLGAWIKNFTLPNGLEIGARNVQRYWLLVAGSLGASLVYWLFFRRPHPAAVNSAEKHSDWMQSWKAGQSWALQPVALGIIALFLAGGPFWLTDLKLALVFPNDRFTLPYMLGICLVTTGLLVLLPVPRWVKVGLLSLGLGFAVGLQFVYATSYTRDWSVQRSLFWQMTWRIPALQPGTTLLSNELPVVHYTDNSLTAPLNWTFDPRNDPREMDYALFYPTLRKEETLSNFAKDQPIQLNYLAAMFHGNTSQMVAFYYNPPGCFRILDPQVDRYNWMIPLYLKESLEVSTTTPILARPPEGQPAPRPPAQIYGAEIPRGWCYYFEQADLARQQKDWTSVARLGDEAFAQDDYPNDPVERFTFIEGYAHTGNWQRSLELTRDSRAISPQVMQPMLCALWARIDKETGPSAEAAASSVRQNTLQTIQSELKCSRAASQTLP